MIFRISQKALFIMAFAGLSSLSPSCRAQAVQFSSSSGINFGHIDFATTHQGNLTLGTNGGLTQTGSGLFYGGGGVPGQVVVSGNSGIIEVKCNSSAALGDGMGTPLTISGIEAAVNTGVSIGAGNQCAGINSSNPSPLMVDLSNVPDPRILFGGTLEIPLGGLSMSGTYSSAASGGAPLNVRVIYQ